MFTACYVFLLFTSILAYSYLETRGLTGWLDARHTVIWKPSIPSEGIQELGRHSGAGAECFFNKGSFNGALALSAQYWLSVCDMQLSCSAQINSVCGGSTRLFVVLVLGTSWIRGAWRFLLGAALQ